MCWKGHDFTARYSSLNQPFLPVAWTMVCPRALKLIIAFHSPGLLRTSLPDCFVDTLSSARMPHVAVWLCPFHHEQLWYRPVDKAGGQEDSFQVLLLYQHASHSPQTNIIRRRDQLHRGKLVGFNSNRYFHYFRFIYSGVPIRYTHLSRYPRIFKRQ